MNKSNYETAPTERLLRLPEVQHRSGLRKSAIYDAMASGTFPRCVKIGRMSVWPSSEIDAWIAARIREGKTAPPAAPFGRVGDTVAA